MKRIAGVEGSWCGRGGMKWSEEGYFSALETDLKEGIKLFFLSHYVGLTCPRRDTS